MLQSVTGIDKCFPKNKYHLPIESLILYKKQLYIQQKKPFNDSFSLSNIFV